MAIGFSLPDIGRRIGPEETGVPDYVTAIAKGLTAGALPFKLQNEQEAGALQNALNRIKYKYEPQLIEANIAHTNAGTGLMGEQTRGLGLENQFLPEKLKLALEAQRFKQENPLLSMPGMVGQLGALKYLQNNPELNSISGQENDQEQGTYADLLKRSILQSGQAKPTLGQYGKALNDYELAKSRYGIGSAEEQQAKVNLNNIAKTGQEGFAKNTNAVLTLNQNIINGVPKVQKILKDLISSPSPSRLPFGIPYKPSDQAAHIALVNEAADTLVKAKGWPNTNESLNTAKQILERGDYETDESYRKRLKQIDKDLSKDLNQAKQIVNQGTALRKEADNDYEIDYNKPIGSLPMMKDGELYFIPSNKVQEALAKGYQYEQQ